MFFGRSRNLVGLDIGDSSIKVVELKDLGKGRGYQVVKLGWEPLSSEAIVDGPDHGLPAGHRDDPAPVPALPDQDHQPVATALSGHHVIVKRISLPVMSDGGTGRVDPLGGRAVHPVRHRGRQPGLPDPRGLEPVRRREHGCPARRGQERQDQRLRQRDHRGRPDTGHGGHRRVRHAERLRGQLRVRARRRSSPWWTSAPRSRSISVLHGGTSVYWRDINIGGNHTPTRSRKS